MTPGRVARPYASRTKAESTTAGEQHVIPGAKKVSDAEVAKRKAGEPLKPEVRNKPADEGLQKRVPPIVLYLRHAHCYTVGVDLSEELPKKRRRTEVFVSFNWQP